MAKTTIFDSRYDEEQWIKQIKPIVEKEAKVDIVLPVCIFTVPATLASLKPEAYMPQLLGLGPYHHFDPNLYDTERYKLAAASRLQKQQFNTLRFDQLVDKLMESEIEYGVRACYHKYLDIEGNTLMWIMAIDGLFLLDFLQIFQEKKDDYSEAVDDLIDHEGRKLSHDSIRTDVMLLENQIPFFLFRKIMSIEISLDNIHDNSLPLVLMNFCRSISPVRLKADFPLTGVLNCSHLLDLLYQMTMPNLAEQNAQEAPTIQIQNVTDYSNSSQQVINPSDSYQIFTALWKSLSSLEITKKITTIVNKVIKLPGMSSLAAEVKESMMSEIEKIMIPSASSLSKMAGMEFCPTTGDNPTIKFDTKEKKFYLPVIALDVHSEVIIRNLIAYEASTASGSLVFGRFADLMDWLIDTAEDVKLLREKKIIHSKLKRDDEVFRLFDGIGKSVRLTNAPSIDKTIKDVNKFYNNSRWVRFDRGVNKFVFDLWKVWTILATILLLLLTGVQSFCSVYTCPSIFDQLNRSYLKLPV